jgi:hypothetical protein
LQNLLDNPGYVQFELAAVESNQRFWEMAKSLQKYYTDRANPVALPQCYQQLGDTYNPDLDYVKIKADFKNEKGKKHPLIDPDGLASDTRSYRELANIVAEDTDKLLAGLKQ